MASIVTPGTVVGNTNSHSPGAGTMEKDGDLISLLTGTVVEEDGVISVQTHNELLRLEVGDTIIGKVSKLHEKSGEILVLRVEGKPDRAIMADQMYAQIHVTAICDRFLHNTADAMRVRDIVRAKVTEAGNVVRVDMRSEPECGVLWALCPPCGDEFIAQQNGDWNVACPTCNNQAFRAMADDFGGGTEMSALNGANKRWSGEAEKLFAKGSSGRATFIAEDVREDGSPREYFRFEDTGGRGGGRKQSAPPGCKLFVGGIPNEADDDKLRKLFEPHGDITDFAIMKDDNGNNRGFGFITFAEKSMADAAISALDGHKIHGRRLGVRDADAPRDKKPKRDRPKGCRLYVGNLPFEASDDDLANFFKDSCDSVVVQWATDRSGKRKAFAFVTIQPEDSGEKVVKELNGKEFMTRKLRVDLAKPSGGKGDRKGGKSARELRAIAEEENSGKKKKRRPRKD